MARKVDREYQPGMFISALIVLTILAVWIFV